MTAPRAHEGAPVASAAGAPLVLDSRPDRETPKPGVGVRHLARRGLPLYHRVMTTPANTIEHEEADGRGTFHLSREGRRLGKMTYRRLTDRLIVVEHTLVDDELRGQGAAHALLDAAVAWARATGNKIKSTCPFTTAQFAKDPSIGDVRG